MAFRSVWDDNQDCELGLLDMALHTYPVIFIDTEFSGILFKTQRNAKEGDRYHYVKFNVDRTRILQFGITVSDCMGSAYATWEFNFKFDLETDPHSQVSINFLKKNGLNFDNLKRMGIEMTNFVDKFSSLISRHQNLTCVTFHGLYDMAYIVEIISKKPLPNTLDKFVDEVARIFMNIADIKYMLRFLPSEFCGGELGLERLAEILRVERIGGSHQAGSDSLLTAEVFHEMVHRYQILDRYEIHSFMIGYLYSLETQFTKVPQLGPFPIVYPVFHCVPPYPQQRAFNNCAYLSFP